MTRRHRMFTLSPEIFLQMLRGETVVATADIPPGAEIREIKFDYVTGAIVFLVESETYVDLTDGYHAVTEALVLYNKVTDTAALMRLTAQLAENLPTAQTESGEELYVKKGKRH